VIVNSLSVSPQHSSDSKSSSKDINIKRYELKTRILKPETRIDNILESRIELDADSRILGSKKLSHQLNGSSNSSNILKNKHIVYQGNSPISNLKKPPYMHNKRANKETGYFNKYRKLRKSNQDSKVSLPSISYGRNEGSAEREQKAKNIYLLLSKN